MRKPRRGIQIQDPAAPTVSSDAEQGECPHDGDAHRQEYVDRGGGLN